MTNKRTASLRTVYAARAHARMLTSSAQATRPSREQPMSGVSRSRPAVTGRGATGAAGDGSFEAVAGATVAADRGNDAGDEGDAARMGA